MSATTWEMRTSCYSCNHLTKSQWWGEQWIPRPEIKIWPSGVFSEPGQILFWRGANYLNGLKTCFLGLLIRFKKRNKNFAYKAIHRTLTRLSKLISQMETDGQHVSLDARRTQHVLPSFPTNSMQPGSNQETTITKWETSFFKKGVKEMISIIIKAKEVFQMKGN